MNYWHMQLHPDAVNDWDANDIRNVLKTGFVGCSGNPVAQLNGIRQGDVIFIRHGSTGIALVRTTGIAEHTPPAEMSEYMWFTDRIPISVLQYLTDSWVNGEGWYIPTTLQSINNDIAWDYVSKLYLSATENMKKEECIELLKTVKPQIILQGPPGTGKTRLAKEVALALTIANKTENARQKIDKFLSTHLVPTDEEKEKRADVSNRLQRFAARFPKENLASLSLEDYAFGKGDNDTFCWFLEYYLWPSGQYSGPASKFKIFWKKDREEYAKSGFIKDVVDDDAAMSMVAEQLSNVVHERALDEARRKLSSGLILKILNSYHPEKYFPINNERCLSNALKLMGIEFAGMDFIQKNLAMQKAFDARRANTNSGVTSAEFMRFLFDNFDMQGDIQVEHDEVSNSGAFKIIQFHPAYSYEDFVRGIAAKPSGNSVIYKTENRVLADFAEQALKNASGNYVLVLDEINRANLPAVLGELIYALEYRYDKEKADETTVEGIYEYQADEESESTRALRLPANLFIIGTMNTADRSVGHIDYAIRRRFAFVDILPSNEPVHQIAQSLFKKVSELFIKNYDTLDWQKPKPERSKHLAPDFRPEDVWLGHSYFITDAPDDEKAKEILTLKRDYEILPILKEYLRDGVLLNSAESIIASLANEAL